MCGVFHKVYLNEKAGLKVGECFIETLEWSIDLFSKSK